MRRFAGYAAPEPGFQKEILHSTFVVPSRVLSTDVKLKKDHAPLWPERCVVCGLDAPNHTVALGTFQVTWLSTLTMSFGKRETVGSVPACASCETRLVWERRGRFLLSGFFIVAAVWLLPKVFGLPKGKLMKLAIAGYGFVGLIPGTLLTVFFPPPLDITSHSDSVWYEFRDERYAAEFAARNASGVIDVL